MQCAYKEWATSYCVLYFQKQHQQSEDAQKNRQLACRIATQHSPELESDPIMVESHQEALVKEMKNAKPRSDIFIPLMKSTFMARRQFILTEARSVVQILDIYPALNQVLIFLSHMLHIMISFIMI